MKFKLIVLCLIVVNAWYIVTGQDLVSKITKGNILLNYKIVEDDYPFLQRWYEKNGKRKY